MKTKFHFGELQVQARAGVGREAARLGKSIESTLPAQAREFLGQQRMAVLGVADARGRVWASLVTGEPGFLSTPDERTVLIAAQLLPDDPLAGTLSSRPPVGMLVIDLATRRRMRVNGNAEQSPDGFLKIHVQQVYANCPKYIQARVPVAGGEGRQESLSVKRSDRLSETQQRWIASSDTFFIASSHHKGGADASHRGGYPGFVRVPDDHTLIWPDYPGNNMFQTFGNLAENPAAGLLFMDFERGATLQLTGSARVIWDAERGVLFAGSRRAVEFDVEQAVETSGSTPWRWCLVDYSPFNPR